MTGTDILIATTVAAILAIVFAPRRKPLTLRNVSEEPVSPPLAAGFLDERTCRRDPDAFVGVAQSGGVDLHDGANRAIPERDHA